MQPDRPPACDVLMASSLPTRRRAAERHVLRKQSVKWGDRLPPSTRRGAQRRPVRVHLDTSDYAVMYCAAEGSAQARVRDWLKDIATCGSIEIGISYHIVFELLKKAEPKYREDRLARARLLTNLCGRNAFPYPTDLGQGPPFSAEGLWVPRIDLEEIEVERVIGALMQAMGRCPYANRHERRALSNRKYVAAWASTNPEKLRQFAIDAWPLRFGRSFVEDGDLVRYLSGVMSAEEANRKLRFYITDPVMVYEVWFEQYGRPYCRAARSTHRDFLVDAQ
jgi:hypothetical protein